MPYTGLVPVPDTPVGIVRALIGDTDAVPLVPPVEGFGDYAQFSDTELTAFLLLGAGKPLRAAGHAYLRLAANATFASKSIATDDLRIDTTKRAEGFRALATAMFNQADSADDIANSADDFFEVTPFRAGRQVIPDLFDNFDPFDGGELEESPQYPGLWE